MRSPSFLSDLTSPQIMGVLNVTPDSFSDGGRFVSSGKLLLDDALKEAEAMVAAGASIIDVGGESTRPGAAKVTQEEEMARVLPVVEALASRIDAVISVDTSTPALMRAAVDVGAGLLNDVRALSKPGALEVAAAASVPVCLMHMQGQPSTMQAQPHYDDVVAEVRAYLLERAQAAIAAGVKKENIILDPGFGFGKTDEHNVKLLQSLPSLCTTGYPVLAGLSRKSMIGRLLGREPQDRLAGSLALALIAAQNGAKIIRVHDVAETHDVLSLLTTIQKL
ncbi:dihydropteroate synthase [Saccharophagus degradans]|uniref:Dihydropteroate synthase n=1 Tax=Saccharophagus degradans (strain 2-40 / ATCC 43961 / DSM 17024) TaxID=203122 RepID=Q21H50_SACD2|nr:dihydropteroate synthase [Saccharophagus degradans]ABD81979.1 Dihydropteroate synthase [Saccharophagus degradans 2-40]